MRNSERAYHSFEDFERNELRRFETPGASVDDMLDAIFGSEDGGGSGRSGYRRWNEEADEEDDE